MAQAQTQHGTQHGTQQAARPAAPPVPAKKKKVKRVQATHTGTVSSYKFLDGSGTFSLDVSTLPSDIQCKLMQSGLTRTLIAGDVKLPDVQKHAAALAAGKWISRETRPPLPNVLSEAMANIAKAKGQGMLSTEKFAKACSVDFWEKHFHFGETNISDAILEARNDMRAKDEVQAAIRLVKVARTRAAVAAGKTVKDKPLDLGSLV